MSVRLNCQDALKAEHEGNINMPSLGSGLWLNFFQAPNDAWHDIVGEIDISILLKPEGSHCKLLQVIIGLLHFILAPFMKFCSRLQGPSKCSLARYDRFNI